MKWQDYVKLTQDEKEEYKFRFMYDKRLFSIGTQDMIMLFMIFMIFLAMSLAFMTLIREQPEYSEVFQQTFMLMVNWFDLWLKIALVAFLINLGLYIYQKYQEYKWVKGHKNANK